MRKIKFIVFVLLACALLFHFRERVVSFFDDIFNRDKVADLAILEDSVNVVKKEIKETPKPLINKIKGEESGSLTVSGILKYTNEERKKEGLSELTLNQNLNTGASAKADDMFKKQYFAHESPEGRGPAEIAEDADYDYLIIGENLALGGFKDDADLVSAWMASPGHRENILRPTYREIGISVKEGTYEGEKVWIAVQEFGTPASLCAKPSDKSYQDISSTNANLADLRKNLEAMKEEIEGMDQNSQEYRNKAEAYNGLIREYNSLVASSRDAVDEYNALVKKYNTCVKEYVD